MGGGFMLSGKSTSFAAANPQFYAASATTRSFDDARYSPAPICNQSNPSSQNIGSSVFESVPTRFEVERAIIDLQRLMHGLSDSKAKIDGLQSLVHHDDEYLRMLQAPGFVKFRDTFSMMQREPSFQNTVIAISCDAAVWEAILSNNAVQDLRGGSVPAAKEEKEVSYNQEPDIALIVLKWIMGFSKSKVFQLVEKFGLLVNEIFQTAPKEKTSSNVTDLLEEKIRSSLLLSLAIVLIVVVTRTDG